MATGLIYDERFCAHDTGPGHPERPDRLRAIAQKLKARHLWDQLVHLPFEPAERRWIERVHDPAYVQRVFDACAAGARYVDTPESAVCPESAEIAQLAVGGVLAAVDAVLAQRCHNAFCAVRPPGHHAERDLSMGFCLFGSVAIAAQYLIEHHGLERVAVLDWDVHHGNGTQHLFESRRDVMFISIHEHPQHLYPGTGYGYERGVGEGEGYTLNLPLDPGAGDEQYRRVMLDYVIPALEAYRPQFVLISAGFDAADDDPLAHMRVTPEGFRAMTRQVKDLAESACGGRLVSVLEGGYDLRGLAESVALHVTALTRAEQQDGMMAIKLGF